MGQEIKESSAISSDTQTSLYIDSESRTYLFQAAKWANFLSIVGFGGIGFVMITFAIVAALSVLGNDFIPGLSWLTSGAFTLFYIVLAVLFIFPCLYMYNFATKMLKALQASDQKYLILSFQNLNLNLRFVGVFTAIGIVLHMIMLLTMFITSFASMD